MAYPAPFHRLVLLGDLYTDRFNMTLSMVPTGGGGLPAVSDTLLTGVAAVVGDWFNNVSGGTLNNGLQIVSAARLTSIKLNRIGANGKYVDAETKEHVYPSPIAGAGNATPAPQLSLAVTLRGSNERALAGRGRIYPPPVVATTQVGPDGRIAASTALEQAKGAMFLMGALNDAYITAGVGAVAGVASKQGAGAFQSLVQVSVGRVVDTIRSRRNKLDEDPAYWGAP